MNSGIKFGKLQQSRLEGDLIKMLKAWIRLLSVKFSNGKHSITYGNKFLEGKNDVSIHVTGSKFMSSLKDSCKIVIDNLPYSEIINLIDGKYFDVEVSAGYKSLGERVIFSGGVLYVSNNRTNTKTTQAIFLCASPMVAKFSQSRINLTLNSGINLYTVLRYVLSKAGVKNPNISTDLKTKIIENSQSVNDTVGGWLNKLMQENSEIVVNSDNSVFENVTIFNAARGNGRLIPVTNSIIDLTGGYPQVSSEGLNFTCMPTFNFVCGDTIKIDNSIIQIPVSSSGELSSPKSYFLDEDGEYMIYEIDYRLENRGDDFSYSILSKSRNRLRQQLGIK